MDYQKTVLNQKVVIKSIVTVHYFEYTSSFFFPGEAHDFWEFLYVDKGEIIVTAGTDIVHMKKGDIIFHKPMEFHDLRANGVIAPNLVVVAFDCSSAAMRYFEHALLRIGDEERDLIAKILTESNHAFSSPLDDPQLKHLARRKDVPAFACEQLIKVYLEQLLIQLIRKGGEQGGEIKTTTSFKERNERDTVNRVILFMEQNLSQRISIQDICDEILIGRSQLQKLFREKTGGGVMEYMARMRMDVAKQLIREGKYNFTEIASRLGYASIYYFSRHFKKMNGMSPSEYSSSVKLRTQAPYEESNDNFAL